MRLRSPMAKKTPFSLPGDHWTSTPLYLTAFDITQQDIYFSRAGQVVGLVHHIANLLRQDRRLAVAVPVQVETSLVPGAPIEDQFRAQLRITADTQVPPHGARLHVQLGQDAGANQVKADILWTSATSDDALRQLTDQLRQRLRQAYPIRGRIIRISPRGIRLNIGSEHGLIVGSTLQLLKTTPSAPAGQPIGLIEVIQVNPHDAWAKVVSDMIPMNEVWRIRNVQEVIRP